MSKDRTPRGEPVLERGNLLAHRARRVDDKADICFLQADGHRNELRRRIRLLFVRKLEVELAFRLRTRPRVVRVRAQRHFDQVRDTVTVTVRIEPVCLTRLRKPVRPETHAVAVDVLQRVSQPVAV